MTPGRKRPFALVSWILIGTGAILVTMGAGGCSSQMRPIRVADEGNGFVEEHSDRAFVPFGTNYYDPETGWPPQVWQQFDEERVEQHFDILRRLGANCARVFLTAATFQPDANTVDEQALAKLDILIDIARRAGVRLIITGPSDWEGQVPYWQEDQYAGEQAIQALEYFWTVVGQRYQGNPTILAWDLANEPAIPWSRPSWARKWNAYLESKYTDRDGLAAAWGQTLSDGESWGSIEMPEDVADRGNPRLYDWQLFRESLADQWVQRQTEALRAVDPTHLITIGYTQWSYPVARPGDLSLYSAFNPRRQAQWLDFISVHYYPLMGRPFGSRDNWVNNLAYLQTVLAYCHVGKPVVLEEYGWYGGGAPVDRPYLDDGQQVRWILAEIEASRRLTDGWLSWPFADTPEATDMARFGGLVRQTMYWKPWGLNFRYYAERAAMLPYPAPELPDFDVSESLTTPMDEVLPMYQQQADMVQAAMESLDPVPTLEEELQEIEPSTAETE